MHELEGPQVQRQGLLRDPSVGPEPGTQQGPEPFQRVDMDFAEPIPAIVPGVLADVPLGDHKLHAVQMSGLVGRKIENRPGDVLRGGKLVGG